MPMTRQLIHENNEKMIQVLPAYTTEDTPTAGRSNEPQSGQVLLVW